MEAVFLDSIGGTAARRSLPAETPAKLIDRYLVFALVLGPAQLESRRNRRASATDDSNSDRVLLGQDVSSRARIFGSAQRNETSNMRSTRSTAKIADPGRGRTSVQLAGNALRRLVLDRDVDSAILLTPLRCVVRRERMIFPERHRRQLVRIDSLLNQVTDHRDSPRR